MPEQRYIDRKKDERQRKNQWLCRPGGHYTARNRIAVQYAPRVGLCGPCILRYCDRLPNGRPNLAGYWVRDWGYSDVEHFAQLGTKE